MEIIDDQPHLTMREAGQRFVDLHGGIDLKHATDIVSQRLRATDSLVKRDRRVFAPEPAVAAAIQKPPMKLTPKRTEVKKPTVTKETNESSNTEVTQHVAYATGYIQRFIDEYAVGVGIPTQTLTDGVSRLLSGQKGR